MPRGAWLCEVFAISPAPATDAQRLRSLNALLEQGLALPSAQRAAWLRGLAPEQASLRSTLQALLQRAEVETDDFLLQPLTLSGIGLLEPAGAALQPGQAVGPWCLVHELGSGGMATVWLAERHDGIRRRVALKLPRLGWSAGSAERVARERDILAALEHPRIARLYEAGVSDQGRPWLAMEYVQGQPLDLHCQARLSPLRDRLGLFLQVADAVAHAHAQMVVHGDLKPNNILVTPQGEVRLLDFGVARLLQDGNAAEAERGQGHEVTPDYAAPEQVSGQVLSAATDVYALGVLLYELLTGVRPYRVGKVAASDLASAILAAEVLPPSTRVTAQPRLARQLRGDLDAVITKALNKAPEQRYASVEAMAADLRRHLTGDVVLARRATGFYRAGRFAGRHRLGLAAGSAVVLALGLGLALATWQWQAAEQERRLAIAQIAKSEAAADFASTVLTDSLDRGQPLTLEDLLARSERFVAATPDPLARAVAANSLAAWQLSQGNAGAAEQVLAKTLAALPVGFDADLRQALGCQHAWALHYNGRTAEGQLELDAALARLSRDPGTRSFCLLAQSWVARNMNQPELAERSAREALATLDAAQLGFGRRRAELTGELAYAHALLGRSGEAEAGYRSAIEQVRRLGKSETALSLDLLDNWANARADAGDVRGALELRLQARALAERRSTNGELPAFLVFNQAATLRMLGRFDEAETEYRQAQALARRSGAVHYEALALVGRAAGALWHGHTDLAQRLLDESRQVLGAEFHAARSPAGEAWRMAQSQVWLRTGQHLEEAHTMLSQLVEDADGQPNASAPALAWQLRGEVASARGQWPPGRRDLHKALALAQAQQRPGQPSRITGQAWLALGKHYRISGDSSAAQDAFAQAHAELARALGDDSPYAREAAALLAAAAARPRADLR